MAKYICEKATECHNEDCADRKEHEHDEWCDSGCDSVHGEFPEAKCMILNPTGVELIAEERKRQIEKEGWTSEHDDEHEPFSMAIAGACYVFDFKASTKLSSSGDFHTLDDVIDMMWPWDGKWWKPTPDDPIRQLTKAGALIVAEIDRLQRQKEKENGKQ